MGRHLIGVCGKARHGKTTVSDHLQSRYGYRELSFADPMKRIIVDGLVRCPPPAHCIPDEISGDIRDYWNHRVRVGRTPFTRWLLQFVGTEVGRTGFDPDVWVKIWEREYDRSSLTIAPDVRFPNEALAIHYFGGEIWRVVRTDADDLGVPGVEHGEKHASETEALEIRHDILIAAPTGIDNLRRLVDERMAAMRAEEMA